MDCADGGAGRGGGGDLRPPLVLVVTIMKQFFASNLVLTEVNVFYMASISCGPLRKSRSFVIGQFRSKIMTGFSL